MGFREWREKSKHNRYLGKVRIAVQYPVGARRTLALMGGGIAGVRETWVPYLGLFGRSKCGKGKWVSVHLL